MSTIGDKYILGGRSDHDRLRVISEIHDGRTRELLLRAGLAPRHRFVEFGCGLGYVTRWAASQGAHATGIDVNEEQVEASAELARQAGLQNAEFRAASIYEPGIEPESVDVSYSRWLMVHLNNPVEAMRAIHCALKPGAVMVCEEADVSEVYTRISDWLWYFCPCDQSSRLDFRGFLERNQATEGDTQWVNYKPRPFSSRSTGF